MEGRKDGEWERRKEEQREKGIRQEGEKEGEEWEISKGGRERFSNREKRRNR